MSYKTIWTSADYERFCLCTVLNREEVEASEYVGCYNCTKCFLAKEINCVIEDDVFCPYCEDVCVVGDASEWPVWDVRFLQVMNWFAYN